VDLSRNFGQHRAAMTGLRRARGRLVFQIDVDLEEEPELLTRFYEVWKAAGDADVVYGVQDRRKGGLFERASGGLFYALFNFLSPHKIPPNLLMARLMTRRYVQALVSHRETELDISSLWQITGFKQVPVTVHKHGRTTTTYTLGRKLELTMRSLTFSNRPLLYIGALGLAILLLSALYFAYVIYVYAFVGEVPSGFTSIVISIWFLGGLIIFSLGVIAVYVSIIFNETKQRPYAIIRDVHPRDTDAPS
jgi:putative glycosyltransferase